MFHAAGVRRIIGIRTYRFLPARIRLSEVGGDVDVVKLYVPPVLTEVTEAPEEERDSHPVTILLGEDDEGVDLETLTG